MRSLCLCVFSGSLLYFCSALRLVPQCTQIHAPNDDVLVLPATSSLNLHPLLSLPLHVVIFCLENISTFALNELLRDSTSGDRTESANGAAKVIGKNVMEGLGS